MDEKHDKIKLYNKIVIQNTDYYSNQSSSQVIIYYHSIEYINQFYYCSIKRFNNFNKVKALTIMSTLLKRIHLIQLINFSGNQKINSQFQYIFHILLQYDRKQDSHSNDDYLKGYNLDERQYSELVMLLDKQKESKEKTQRRIDLNKINYFMHLKSENSHPILQQDIYLLQNENNYFNIAHDASTNDSRSQITNRSITKSNNSKTKIKKYENKQKQFNNSKQKLKSCDKEGDFHNKSMSENKYLQLTNQKLEYSQNKSLTSRLINQDETYNKYIQQSCSSTQASTHKPESSKNKNKAINQYFYSTFQYNSSQPSTQRKIKNLSENKTINSFNDTSSRFNDSKFNNFIFKGGGIQTSDEEYDRSSQPLSTRREEQLNQTNSSKSIHSLHLDNLVDSNQNSKLKQNLQQKYFPFISKINDKSKNISQNKTQQGINQMKFLNKSLYPNIGTQPKSREKTFSLDNNIKRQFQFDKNRLKLDLTTLQNISNINPQFLTQRSNSIHKKGIGFIELNLNHEKSQQNEIFKQQSKSYQESSKENLENSIEDDQQKYQNNNQQKYISIIIKPNPLDIKYQDYYNFEMYGKDLKNSVVDIIPKQNSTEGQDTNNKSRSSSQAQSRKISSNIKSSHTTSRNSIRTKNSSINSSQNEQQSFSSLHQKFIEQNEKRFQQQKYNKQSQKQQQQSMLQQIQQNQQEQIQQQTVKQNQIIKDENPPQNINIMQKNVDNEVDSHIPNRKVIKSNISTPQHTQKQIDNTVSISQGKQRRSQEVTTSQLVQLNQFMIQDQELKQSKFSQKNIESQKNIADQSKNNDGEQEIKRKKSSYNKLEAQINENDSCNENECDNQETDKIIETNNIENQSNIGTNDPNQTPKVFNDDFFLHSQTQIGRYSLLQQRMVSDYVQDSDLKNIYGCDLNNNQEEYEVLGLQHYCDFSQQRVKKLQQTKNNIPHGIPNTPVDIPQTEKEFKDLVREPTSIENLKRIEEPKRHKISLNIDQNSEKHELGENFMWKYLHFYRNKETLERKFQQYLKQCFMSSAPSNSQQMKNGLSFSKKQKNKQLLKKQQTSQSNDFHPKNKSPSIETKPSKQDSNENTNSLKNLTNLLNNQKEPKTPANPHGYIKFIVNINPPSSRDSINKNTGDSPLSSSFQKKRQTFQFVSYKADDRYSISSHSNSSNMSSASSENFEDSHVSSSQSSIQNYINQDSENEDSSFPHRIADTEKEIGGGNFISNLKSKHKDNESIADFQSNVGSPKAKFNIPIDDFKKSFIIVRNYLVQYFQSQVQDKYVKKQERSNKLAQMMELKQQKQIILRDEEIKKVSARRTTQRKNTKSPHKAQVKTAEKKEIKTDEILQHHFQTDYCLSFPFFINSRNSFNIEANKRSSIQLQQKNLLDSFFNFSTLDELNKIPSKTFNKTIVSKQDDNVSSSDSSSSSIQSIGNTYQQLGFNSNIFDIYDQNERVQFTNDIEIYEDENYNPYSLSNQHLKQLSFLNLNENNSLFENLGENIPPIISEIHDDFIEGVLNKNNNENDPNIKQLLSDKQFMSNKYEKITQMVTQQDNRSFKQSYINYCKEEEDILIGKWEDSILFKSDMIGQFSDSVELNRQRIKHMKQKLEIVKTKNASFSNTFKKKTLKQKKINRALTEYKEEGEIDSVIRFDTMKGQQYDSDAGSENNAIKKSKSIEKKGSLPPNSPKESSLGLSHQESNQQTNRSKFQRFQGSNQKKQNESNLEDSNRLRRVSQVAQSPLYLFKSPFSQQSNQLDIEKDFTPLAGISTLFTPNQQKQKDQTVESSLNQNHLIQNTTSQKIPKSPYLPSQQNNLLGVSFVPLNQSSTFQNQSTVNSSNKTHNSLNVSQRADGMDKKSLSMRSRLLSINKRKLMTPEEQLFGAIKDSLFNESNYFEINIQFEDIFQKYNQIKINQTDNEGNSYLILASRAGNLEMVKDLVYRGININHQNDNGDSSFHMALAYGNSEVADFLLSCKVDQSLLNKNGLSAWDLVQYK